jgi:membrane protein DedA with SNARE-associated domain
VKPRTKKKLEIVILLSLIWFVITLPLPWVLTAPPEAAQTQLLIILEITIMVSIPFVILAIAWTLKPELTT